MLFEISTRDLAWNDTRGLRTLLQAVFLIGGTGRLSHCVDPD